MTRRPPRAPPANLSAPIAALCLAAISAAPGRAQAAGFATQHFGGEQGSVVATNPTALYYNPAGLAFSRGVHLLLDGELALRDASATHAGAPTDPPDPAGGEGANAGRAHLFNVLLAPALGASMTIGRLALGAGLFVPFGGQESFDSNPRFAGSAFPLAADGPQRWHVIHGEQAYVYGSAGAAYRIGPMSIGLAANLVFSSVSLLRAVVPPFGDPDTANEGRAQLDVSGVSAAFGAGIMLEAIPDRLWLGASYQSQPGLGAQTLNGTLASATPYSMPPASTTQQVSFTQALPDVVRAGARWRVRPDLELRLLGDFTRWSVMRTQCLALAGTPCAVLPDGSAAPGAGVLLNLRRDWRDTVHVHAGASYWIDPVTELFAGAGVESAAVPDGTLEPTFMDGDNVEAALGGRYSVAGFATVALSATLIQFFDRDDTGRSQLADAALPTRQQDAGGRYTQTVAVFDVTVEKTF